MRCLREGNVFSSVCPWGPHLIGHMGPPTTWGPSTRPYRTLPPGIPHPDMFKSVHYEATENLSCCQVNNRFDLAKSECRQEIFPTSANLPMVIIGFSKGCVVLNQLLHELHIAKENLHSFVDLVVQMFWLDGGHNGGSETWITDSEILKSLLGTKTEIRVHVTPYQVHDERRRWIGQEHEKFVENLRRHGVNVFDTIHFVDEERCLEKHFDVLRVF